LGLIRTIVLKELLLLIAITFNVILQTSSEWHLVFYISAGIYMIGCVFYAFAASGNRQSWSQPTEDTDPKTGNTLALDSVN
jgi:hypothetical protein